MAGKSTYNTYSSHTRCIWGEAELRRPRLVLGSVTTKEDRALWTRYRGNTDVKWIHAHRCLSAIIFICMAPKIGTTTYITLLLIYWLFGLWWKVNAVIEAPEMSAISICNITAPSTLFHCRLKALDALDDLCCPQCGMCECVHYSLAHLCRSGLLVRRLRKTTFVWHASTSISPQFVEFISPWRPELRACYAITTAIITGCLWSLMQTLLTHSTMYIGLYYRQCMPASSWPSVTDVVYRSKKGFTISGYAVYLDVPRIRLLFGNATFIAAGLKQFTKTSFVRWEWSMDLYRHICRNLQNFINSTVRNSTDDN